MRVRTGGGRAARAGRRCEREVAGHFSHGAEAERSGAISRRRDRRVYRTNGSWRQTLSPSAVVRARSLGVPHGALLSGSDEAIAGWGSSLMRALQLVAVRAHSRVSRTVAGRDDWRAWSGAARPTPRSAERDRRRGVLLAATCTWAASPGRPDGGATWQPTIDVEAGRRPSGAAHPERPELVLAAAAARSACAGATTPS